VLLRFYWDDEMEADEMGETCGKHVGEEKCIQIFGGKT
jgi:hypothetical protein